MQLTEHRYSGKAARYYIDGRRVSHDDYETAIITAHMEGRDHSCFLTKCRETGNGQFHRVNYSCIGGKL